MRLGSLTALLLAASLGSASARAQTAGDAWIEYAGKQAAACKESEQPALWNRLAAEACKHQLTVGFKKAFESLGASNFAKPELFDDFGGRRGYIAAATGADKKREPPAIFAAELDRRSSADPRFSSDDFLTDVVSTWADLDQAPEAMSFAAAVQQSSLRRQAYLQIALHFSLRNRPLDARKALKESLAIPSAETPARPARSADAFDETTAKILGILNDVDGLEQLAQKSAVPRWTIWTQAAAGPLDSTAVKLSRDVLRKAEKEAQTLAPSNRISALVAVARQQIRWDLLDDAAKTLDLAAQAAPASSQTLSAQCLLAYRTDNTSALWPALEKLPTAFRIAAVDEILSTRPASGLPRRMPDIVEGCDHVLTECRQSLDTIPTPAARQQAKSRLRHAEEELAYDLALLGNTDAAARRVFLLPVDDQTTALANRVALLMIKNGKAAAAEKLVSTGPIVQARLLCEKLKTQPAADARAELDKQKSPRVRFEAALQFIDIEAESATRPAAP
jgi:hypothetical protein